MSKSFVKYYWLVNTLCREWRSPTNPRMRKSANLHSLRQFAGEMYPYGGLAFPTGFQRNAPDPSTFYVDGPQGYLDYPTLSTLSKTP